LFNIYQGHVQGYSNSRNPAPGAYSLLNGHLRYDLSRYLHTDESKPLAFVAHADNLINHAVWLPDWQDRPGDSTFFNPGRRVYFGLELSLGAK
jgi:hypothetical protein